MSYYFVIVGTQDNSMFEYEFGTAKQGGDGIARFPEQARHMNQFIVHSSLDIVEEVQWGTGQMYLKCVDRFYNNHVSCFITGGNVKFLLLHAPTQLAATNTSRTSTSIAANPTSPQTEEAIKQFFGEIYEIWVKVIMNPFYQVNMPVKSLVFKSRVAAAAKKYL
ncbi:BgTH12-00902 [Blumeria graminis f. sp. triticale]|uniref:Bgt-3233 n=3 Tax=Blumeria graminis TaxID=34373 RepID=A0A9X9MNI7_BLUGR|nr:subunit of the transport protein particle (TRAPP) complex of the cis-Golgi [Blumeria graminis f. sp. tritici 96224]CAD6505411.1 BgTH12-00902 [Blumeria graminis f. sp. triticale]VDB93506.1 Bgt-3233 [Blumeria graminis f. sp. tritici]